jgi:hypothetical protein
MGRVGSRGAGVAPGSYPDRTRGPTHWPGPPAPDPRSYSPTGRHRYHGPATSRPRHHLTNWAIYSKIGARRRLCEFSSAAVNGARSRLCGKSVDTPPAMADAPEQFPGLEQRQGAGVLLNIQDDALRSAGSNRTISRCDPSGAHRSMASLLRSPSAHTNASELFGGRHAVHPQEVMSAAASGAIVDTCGHTVNLCSDLSIGSWRFARA